jgi:hypothetical protein
MQRLEAMERRMANPSGPTLDPQEQLLSYLDRQEALMQRLGYTRRASAPPQVAQEPPEKNLIDNLLANLPTMLNAGMTLWAQHLQTQIRIAELQAIKSGVIITPTPTPPEPTPQQQQEASKGAQAQAQAHINESMRAEVGENFDTYVSTFHGELDRIGDIIIAKFTEGLKSIIEEQATDATEQQEIMADHGAFLAEWYRQIPSNAHSILVSYQSILLPVLKTHKPIWDSLSKAPPMMHHAFIAGFCDPSRLEEEEEEEEQQEQQEKEEVVA